MSRLQEWFLKHHQEERKRFISVLFYIRRYVGLNDKNMYEEFLNIIDEEYHATKERK